MDHALCVIWPSEVAILTSSSMQRLDQFPNITQAMSRYASTQQAISREWLVNVGHRTASERLGHLICELYIRLEAVGLTRDQAFELPLTQAELGDTLALSAVHVNRTLMELRRLKLVTFQNRQVVIHDFAALRIAAGFDARYLQINEDTAGSNRGYRLNARKPARMPRGLRVILDYGPAYWRGTVESEAGSEFGIDSFDMLRCAYSLLSR